MAATAEKEIKYDLDGYEVITAALRELISEYPGLALGDNIAFATLGEDSGKAMFPTRGAVIETESKNVLGDVTQVCLYPFNLVYRAAGLSENRKAGVKEWLDTFGRWLEKQAVTINGNTYTLDSYPKLSGNREFLAIERATPAYLDSVNENNSENWVISISARYKNKFNKFRSL